MKTLSIDADDSFEELKNTEQDNIYELTYAVLSALLAKKTHIFFVRLFIYSGMEKFDSSI